MAIKKHSQNVLYIFAGDATSRLLGFLAVAYLARMLGKPEFGIINIGVAVLNYTLLIGNSGLGLIGTRAVSSGSEDIAFLTGRILVTRFLLSAAAYIVTAAVIFLFVTSPEISGVTLIYLLFLFPTALMPDWFFQGRQEMGTMALGRFWGMLFYLLFVLLFVQTSQDTMMTAWSWVAGGVANAVWLLIIFRRRKYNIRFHLKNAKLFQLWKTAFPLGVASLISQVVVQFPLIYLGWFATTTDAGIFSAAFRTTALLLIFDRVFYTVFFPVISRTNQYSPERSPEMIRRVLKMVIFCGLVISLLAIVSAEFLITLIFSEKYLEAVPLFQILAGYFVVTIINSALAYSLVGLGYEKTYTRALSAGLVVFLIAIYFLHLYTGLQGVAIALIANQIANLIYMMIKLNSLVSLNLNRYLITSISMTFLAILPVLLIFKLMLPLSFLFILIIGAPLLAWVGGIRFDDIRYFKKVFI